MKSEDFRDLNVATVRETFRALILAVESAAFRASNVGPAKLKAIERVSSNTIKLRVKREEVTCDLLQSKEDLTFVLRGEIIIRGTVGFRPIAIMQASTVFPGPFISCRRSCLVVAEAIYVDNEQAIPGGHRC
jgi:hypothetical protein